MTSFYIAWSKFFTVLLQFPLGAMPMKSSYMNTELCNSVEEQSPYLYNASTYFLFHNVFLYTYLYLQTFLLLLFFISVQHLLQTWLLYIQ